MVLTEEAGRLAYWNGVPRTANPWSKEPYVHLWYAGWEAARDECEEAPITLTMAEAVKELSELTQELDDLEMPFPADVIGRSPESIHDMEQALDAEENAGPHPAERIFTAAVVGMVICLTVASCMVTR